MAAFDDDADKISVTTSDGQTFNITKRATELSSVLKEMDTEDSISLPQISSGVFVKIVEFIDHYLQEAMTKITKVCFIPRAIAKDHALVLIICCLPFSKWFF